MTIITRFAPSPTGYLHIGSARTALFNYLFAKHHKGKYLLRIEDTDRKRSTREAVDAIFDGLAWLDLMPDEEPVYQFKQADRHREVAEAMLSAGKAYYCYASQAELDLMRETAKAENRPLKYDGRWRDRDPKEAPKGVDPVIRLKAPTSGETKLNDLVQGEVIVQHEQLDDMVLLRADGTPTYMLSVVVDDHDMGITHVIRGDDHLTNAFRQIQIYKAMGWDIPEFAHIPLIHGEDGAKLSKRHGALGVDAYREMGLLPEALCNYLARLGWSHGDDEIFSREQAIDWFTTEAIGKAPARLDFTKLMHVNAHYLKEKSADELLGLLAYPDIADHVKIRLLKVLDDLKERVKNLNELRDMASLYHDIRPILYEKEITIEEKEHLSCLINLFEKLPAWEKEGLESAIKTYCEQAHIKMGKVGPPIRLALTGKVQAPGLGTLLYAMGKEESLTRLKDALPQ